MEAFKRVEAARAKGRPTGYDFISNILTGFLQLHGDRRFGDDQAVVAGIGWLNDLPVTAIAIDRGKDTKEKRWRETLARRTRKDTARRCGR